VANSRVAKADVEAESVNCAIAKNVVVGASTVSNEASLRRGGTRGCAQGGAAARCRPVTAVGAADVACARTEAEADVLGVAEGLSMPARGSHGKNNMHCALEWSRTKDYLSATI
jgi:hypothetical protein